MFLKYYFLILLLPGLLFSPLVSADTDKQKPVILIIKKMPYTINGHSTSLYRIEQPDGTWGFHGKEGEFFGDNPGNWMMHCHMLYHQAAGMMTFINYKGVKVPNLPGAH
ncbi:Multicopper oxidase [Legionella birminghamensis]|uniref:Multicopper oxidase n=1 Tax=Legionella birminghamensis TaxID=28083 RepID=A0A378I9S2_9GAMM|nr:multicopper oxidase domain-containing protein [Legionella birminghamensis]KTC69314.1 Multicopper oxidase [Legionella birminghamensis]STX31576.1 Multicopper oxidase [Legionella birminghamensis]